MKKKFIISESIKYLMLTTLALIFLVPIYIALVYSFKDKSDIAFTGISFPSKLVFDNYIEAIKSSNLFLAMKNSAISTVATVIILAIICSMAAYVISRSNKKGYSLLYMVFLASIVLPFQVVMLPLYTTLRGLSLQNTIPGYVLASVGFQIAYNIFIFTSFVKTVPRELDESASIDGASVFRTFFQIVFPLLKPIIVTGIILNTLSVWNDFSLALIIMMKTELRTLSLAQYYFISQYNTNLGSAFAAFIMSIIPVIILYIILQKHIIKGIVSGAVKG